MVKKILECQYCGSIITEKDTTCPKCGANCSSVIKEYKKAKEEELEKERKELKERTQKAAQSISNGINTSMKTVSTVIIGISILMIIMILFFALNMFGIFGKSKQKESVTGTINETIKNTNYSLEVDSYESYEYYDDFFKNCNTKEGYQKVAFHFLIENTSDDTISTRNIVHNITLKAEDELVEESDLNADTHFCEVLQGKKEYNKLPVTDVLSNDKISGYIGYQVPKNKETLKFIVEEDLILEFDNPFYEGEE